jgi:hypothetical protein
MHQLREFARPKDEFDQSHVRVVGISADEQEHAGVVWDEVTGRQFTILSDRGAVVIRECGLLHERGQDDQIAIRVPRSSSTRGGRAGAASATRFPTFPRLRRLSKASGKRSDTWSRLLPYPGPSPPARNC